MDDKFSKKELVYSLDSTIQLRIVNMNPNLENTTSLCMLNEICHQDWCIHKYCIRLQLEWFLPLSLRFLFYPCKKFELKHLREIHHSLSFRNKPKSDELEI